jgi:PAS domain S-box-containing protein
MSVLFKTWPLRRTAVSIFALCSGMLLVLFFSIFYPSMSGMIRQSEEIVLKDQRTVVEKSLFEKIGLMRTMTLEMSIWDQSIAFVEGRDEDFLEKDLPEKAAWKTSAVNMALFVDAGGRVVYSEFYDYLKGAVMPEPAGYEPAVSLICEKLRERYGETNLITDLVFEGAVILDKTPYYICASPIAVYNETEKPSGVLIYGLLLTSEYIREISGYPQSVSRVLEGPGAAGLIPYEIDRSDFNSISMNIPLKDFEDNTMMLVVSRPRYIIRNGFRVILVTSLFLAAAIIGMSSLLCFIFIRFVLNPLFRLNKDVEGLKGSQQLPVEKYGRSLEISSLASSVNGMLKRLVDKEEAEALLKRRIEQQELMRELSELFASGGDVETIVNGSLAMVGRFLNVSRVFMSRINYAARQVEYPYTWRREGVPYTPIGVFPLNEENTVYKLFTRRQQDHIVVDGAGDTPEHIPLYDGSVKAFVSAPVFVSDLLWGILTIDQYDAVRHWEESDIQLIRLISHGLSNAVSKSIIQDNLSRISALVENTPRFVLYMSAGGKIEYLNPAISANTGYSEEEYRAGGLGIVLDPEDMRLVREVYLPGVFKQGKEIFEITTIRKTGERHILSVCAFVVRRRNGETGVGVTANDVTEFHRLRRELIAAKEQAEHYNKAKTGFLSRMSHEMRTPMNAIINLADLANITGAGQRKHYLDQIKESAESLMDIINDILDMMKFENGTFELVSRPFELSGMLRRAAEKTRIRAEEKQQQFTADIAGDLPAEVVADEKRLEQAIRYILDNAVKFTPDKGEIGFSARKLAEDNAACELCFEVRDTGIGISGELQKRIWQIFEQGDNSISRQYGGVGLGLSIAKGIVELMDGDIRVESELGKGSRFICTVSVGKSAGPVPGDAGENSAGGKTSADPAADTPDGSVEAGTDTACDAVPANFAGRRILLADDVEINREIILALLEGTGIVIDCAVNGSRAVEIFAANTGAYDLLLMDLHMPVMDGFEATRRIRRLGIPGADTVPIVAVTADTGSDIIAQCRQAGMSGHIGKPVDLEILVKLITRYLPAGELQGG